MQRKTTRNTGALRAIERPTQTQPSYEGITYKASGHFIPGNQYTKEGRNSRMKTCELQTCPDIAQQYHKHLKSKAIFHLQS